MTYRDIENDKFIKDFFQARDLRTSTKEVYLKKLFKYCTFVEKTPTELINEAEKEEDHRIRMKDRQIKRYLLDYLNFLKKSQFSYNFIKQCIMTVKTFYREFEIELPNIRLKRNNQNDLQTIEDIPSKDEIKEALGYSNKKYKGIILLMSASGMGSSEIRNLKYSDFLTAIEELDVKESDSIKNIYLKLRKNNGFIGVWKIRRIKTGMPYITFSTHESLTAIADYILSQERDKNHIKTPDDWLFDSSNKQTASSTLIYYLRKINDTLGCGFSGRQRKFKAHSLRKYFASTLNKNKLPELATHWMLGHRIDQVTEAYFKADIDSLKKEYLKAVNDLSFEKVKIKTVTSKEYDRLLNDSKEKDEKIAAMEKRMELLEKLMADNDFANELTNTDD